MGTDAQKLTYFNPRLSGESAFEGLKKADFRARMTLQAELFLVVILNTILGVSCKCYPPKKKRLWWYNC